MDFNTPFINATTVGAVTSETTIAPVWDSIIRTIASVLLVSLASKLVIFVHLARSNAAAAQVVAVNGHLGGSLHSVLELITNRRKGAFRHYYKRRWLLSLLFLSTVLFFHVANFTINAFIQQKGSDTVLVSELPVTLRRISAEEIRADFGCINKQLTYRNGQSDLAIGLCNIFPVPTLFISNCMGLVRREAEGIYGIYHPNIDNIPIITVAGTTFIGPMLVSGNTLLFPSGTLPILEIKITEDLVRNLFSDMVDGETTVRSLRYSDVSGVFVEGLGLCGNVNVSSRVALNKLIGGLGFVEGKSRILDPLGNRTMMEVQTSASRTSIRTVIFIAFGALGALVLSFVTRKIWDSIYGASTNVPMILSTAISQIGGTDCAMPAAVSNGDVKLLQVNTVITNNIDRNTLHLGIYRDGCQPEVASRYAEQVKTLLAETKRGADTYQGSGLRNRRSEHGKNHSKQ